ncbi:hypothetical protein A5320_02645 [Rheinheimera sp. SA_1]|uniref:amino acid adenylation domain-containing protein n=1 Tax=Rheinheimera sp. SA_1 TaxID=1827365 RepID=UPI0008009039|nr:amino acid adenylation domain-containing protein [Rheinheimera sp. SA_1]OBP16326.1 hypothetical protein A5320_02645 [Rheinheimera sp. SA_1]
MNINLSDLKQQYAALSQQWQQQASGLSFSLAGLLAMRAATAPAAAALEYGQIVLSYAQLDEQVTTISRALLAKFGPSISRVALSVAPGIELIVSLLAIQRAGAAYIPIDPKYPDARIRQILVDGQPDAWITSETFGRRFDFPAHQLVTTDELWRATQVADLAPEHVPLNHAAYIMYTSGTTGQPKGVVVSHQNIANYLAAVHQCYAISAQDRILQFCSVSFDTFIEELGLTLFSGACLVVRPEDILASSDQFWQTVKQLQITAVSLPTAYWHVICDQLHSADLTETSLRLCIIGGESYDKKRLQAWFSAVPAGMALFNSYGPTEATVVITVGQLTPTALQSNLVGRPLSSGLLVLVDAQLKPVVDGPGEVLVTGPAVSAGYHDNPAQTALKFVVLPDWPDGPVFYRTGDRAVFQAEGSLEYLGRIDNQVKLRGFRLELGEIEFHLSAYKGMNDVAVVKHATSECLVAHYSAVAEPNPAELRQLLQQKLPEFMVPAHYVYHAALPINTHGKIDRKILSQWTLPAVPADSVEERPAVHAAALLQILQDILQQSPLQPADNFYRLGGTVEQLQLAAQRIRLELHIDVTADLLGAQPTVQQMAQCIDALALLQQLWGLTIDNAAYHVAV